MKTRVRAAAKAIPICVVIAACIGWATRAQEPIRTDSEFRVATDSEKRALLNGLATHRVHLPASELRTIVRAGIDDTDPEVRIRALGAVAGRAGAVRFSTRDELRERWKSERPVLNALRADVVRALEDPDARAREAAILALVNLDYQETTSKRRIELSLETVQSLAHRFKDEPTTRIRAQIANEFALTTTDSPVVSEVLLLAIHDDSAEVIHQAVLGVARRKQMEGLARLVQLLGHNHRAVRVAIAQAFAHYGALAIPYLPQLETAIREEPDPIAKKTMEGTMALLLEAKAARERPK